ncbi:MAG: M20/M25/M40 family metallo-hydrolase [Planctomycetaceae bacterium]|nr:M20/M25/M40 family metallo-hydrolase [Planctomycetaceae bacterium]
MVSLDEKAAVRLVMDLISIPGGSGQESLVADRIIELLADAGLAESAVSFDTANRRSPAGGEIGNLIVRLPGTQRVGRRLLMAHMDTVPLAVGCIPVRDGDWIRPKSGATALGGDNRAGCAVILTAVLEILKQQLPHPPLTLLFTVQEETGLRGARALTVSKLGKPETCFNWDGRDPASLIIGAVGATNLKFRIEGIASHAGAHPEDGVNAAVIASLAIADLQKNGWHGLVRKGRQRGASNVGVVRGGDATNVVMPHLAVEAEVRSHDADFRNRIVQEWESAFQTASTRVKNADGKHGDVQIEQETRYEAFRMPEESDCVIAAAGAVTAAGLRPVTQICDGGLDANWMARHGFPAVTLGCGQHSIHTVDEKLNLPEFLDACRIGLLLATGVDTPAG